MRQHRRAPGAPNPAQGIGQRRPALRHEAGLALHQPVVEHLALAAADTLRHQIAAEVTAGDETGIGRKTQRAFIGAGHAVPFQRGGDLGGAHAAAVTVGGQAGLQRSVGRVDAQADDVDGVTCPGNRDLDTVNEDQRPERWLAHRRPARGCRRSRKPI